MSTLAERYARAVFELGNETKELAQLVQQVSEIAESYTASPELRAVLDNPLVEESQRAALLGDVAARMRLSRIAHNTVRLLARRHRLHILPDIARALRRLEDEQAGVVRATVVSAEPLAETYCRRLTERLTQLTQRRVVLEKEVDPALIAGVLTRIGDLTIDGSIEGRLADLERRLLAG